MPRGSRNSPRQLTGVQLARQRAPVLLGCMYYAALRPEEVTDLRRPNITTLPDADGEFTLTNSQPPQRF
jgi:hypothetical protein